MSRLELEGNSSSMERRTWVGAQLKKANARVDDEKLAVQVASEVWEVGSDG